jgi:hypothetical protein
VTTPKRKPGRPATGTDPTHGVRIPDRRWDAVDAAAKAAGVTRTAVVNALLAWYAREPGAKLPKRPDAG